MSIENDEPSRDEKWTAGYQQGRRDAVFSTRIQQLEHRMSQFEEKFGPKLTTMEESLKTLVGEALKSKSNWQWWWDLGARFVAFIYRAAVLAMFSAVFVHNTELGKALAPWLIKWVP